MGAMIRRSLAPVAALMLAIFPLAGCAAAKTANAAAQAEDLVPLTIATSSGARSFLVEMARTPAEQERGLMFRTELAADRGMLFPYDPPQPASFWMKNTLIPLDMIFIRRDGTIARIAENTIPESLQPVPSGEPVGAVLEIAGGGAAALGIAVGDKVSWHDPRRKGIR
ncbi:DUF192 domain-containing protein [Sphingomonas fennica]|uniref:DUF192 domain-containing protein n=1 Tax=Edaphosphingomonas fennica TaxID=114404 RepID=A0A2T4HMR8_9SPHN|nr:DUF192 domain-containing protein [Sphingomonas fennica]PTD17095.1 hypothetical protein CV103_19015 [Sphingomonas fennica]